MNPTAAPPGPPAPPQNESERLAGMLAAQGPEAVLAEIGPEDGTRIARVIESLPMRSAVPLFDHLSDRMQSQVMAALDVRTLYRLANGRLYPEGSVGRVMGSPRLIAWPEQSLREVAERMRLLPSEGIPPTVVFVIGEAGKVVGSVPVSRLVTGDPTDQVASIMDTHPVRLHPSDKILDLYPALMTTTVQEAVVVDADGQILGTLRADTLFRAASMELANRTGEGFGVDKDERLGTPSRTSLKMRLPWLVLNLGTCFLPAIVVVLFEGTLQQHALLASFLTVLVGQTINAGEQALSVMVRALTFADVRSIRLMSAVRKELLVGIAQGLVCGPIAGLGMYVAVTVKGHDDALALAIATCLATFFAGIVAGVSGTAVPWVLKRFGLDPALTSHIALTTATDVAAIVLLLGLAAMITSWL